MKIFDKIKTVFGFKVGGQVVNRDVPTHPADTYLLLKKQIRDQFDVEPAIEIHIHSKTRELAADQQREEDWKMVNFVEEMAELWDLKVTTSSTPSVKTNFDYGNGIIAFTNLPASDYFEYKSKEEE